MRGNHPGSLSYLQITASGSYEPNTSRSLSLISPTVAYARTASIVGGTMDEPSRAAALQAGERIAHGARVPRLAHPAQPRDLVRLDRLVDRKGIRPGSVHRRRRSS